MKTLRDKLRDAFIAGAEMGRGHSGVGFTAWFEEYEKAECECSFGPDRVYICESCRPLLYNYTDGNK